MLIEKLFVGYEHSDKNPMLQRQITGNLGGYRFDFTFGIVFFKANEQVEIGLLIGITSGPRAEYGDLKASRVDPPS